MSVGLQEHRPALLAAWQDVIDSNTDTDWALFGYEGQTNNLKVVSKGSGGIEELREDLNSGKIMYAFLKVDDPKTSLSKFVLINWQGEGAPVVRKGTCANHIRDVGSLFTGAHLTLHARTEDDVEPELIIDKVANAGSAYSFKTPRSETGENAGPVGTTYHRVQPNKEINAKERDQFWIKEEQEEKNRVAAEKVRKDKERKRIEEEIKARDAREAAERENAAEKRNEAIARRRAAEHSQEIARRREEDDKETQRLLREQEENAAVANVNTSEALRRQRSKEAKELIGHSTSQARAIFEQNSAQGQMSNRNYGNIPQKPLRSIVSQRINNLTQQSESNNSLLRNNEDSPPMKTSPIKNIDKIKLSLETPSQIQQSIQIDPAISDLSPSDVSPVQFTSVAPCKEETSEDVNRSPNHTNPQNEDFIKQNILDNDIYDTSLSTSSNDFEDDDSDNKFSTIKRSPHSKNNISDGSGDSSAKDQGDASRQNTVIENVQYKDNGHTNGSSTPDDVSPEALEDDGLYQDLDEDPGLMARALYDYQAADESEITFDPGDIISHIDQIDEGWWQGLGPQGVFGLFPANYVELIPNKPKQ
ncbi:actin binding protein 1 [Arctopsyche grandis]|uniref:actin binding protein 1 n=1 Tax=Arctopsyche grandis TaxID=121162 RepID=UPI00406D8E16